MPLLPPPKPKMDPADEWSILVYCDGLIWESYQKALPYFDQAARNYNLYLGRHWQNPAPDASAARYVFNRIRTILLSHAAIQNGTRPKCSLLPRQSGRRGLCFIDVRVLANLLPQMAKNPDLAQILAAIPQECIAPPPAVPAPLPREVYETLSTAIEQGKLLAEQAMMARLPVPPVIPPELVVEINDTTCAKALQVLFDAKWDDCGGDLVAITDSLENGICGWSHIFYRWDPQAERHLLHNCEFRQVFLDPTRRDISMAGTAVFEMCLSEEQAVAEYPEFAKIIDDSFTIGKPVRAGEYYQLAEVYENTSFRRKMGIIRHTYVRNQPYPMPIAEALERGLIQMGMPYQAPAPVKEESDGTTTQGDTVEPDERGGIGPSVSGDHGSVDRGDSIDRGDSLDVDGLGPGRRNDSVDVEPGEAVETPDQPVDGGGGADRPEPAPAAVGGQPSLPPQPPAAVPAQPTAYLLVNGDETAGVKPMGEVKYWGPGWPMRRGIREIIIIAGKVVLDHEYEGADIPLTHNVNFPLLNAPWGQGTPEDLEGLNLAVDEIISDLVHHIRQGSFPPLLISEELEKKNPEISREAFRSPGTTLTAPGDIMTELKNFMQQIEPAQASTDIWRFLTQLLDLLDKQGDMANILQGNTQAGMSGKLFADATAAAQTAILFRAKRTETMLKYLAKLMLGGLARMSPEAMAEAVPQYPVYVWDAFKQWAKQGLVYDLNVEITAGGIAGKQQRANTLIAAKTAGVTISQTTLQGAFDLDPEEEKKNLREEVAESQPQAPLTPVGTASQTSEPAPVPPEPVASEPVPQGA